MEPNEIMVESEDTELEDLPAGIEEESDESEESLESLMTEDGEATPEADKPEPKEGARTEPGYVKRRVQEAVDKAIRETESRMNAEFDRRIAPLMAKMQEDEAQELVRSRKVADIETARELVKLRHGEQPAAPQEQQPRQDNGQFAPKEDAGTKARIAMLRHQADRIAETMGLDVRAEFTNNPDVKKAVISGDMDFYDVAAQMKEAAETRRKPPAPVRSPNGASSVRLNAIDQMSDEQFDRMDKNIDKGARYTLR